MANWGRKSSEKRILFSNEKMFDLDGIYNSENGEKANRRSSKKTAAEKVMVWLEDVAPLVLFEKRHSRSVSLHQGSTVCCSTIRKQVDFSTREWNNTYSSRNIRPVFSTKIHGRQIVSI